MQGTLVWMVGSKGVSEVAKITDTWSRMAVWGQPEQHSREKLCVSCHLLVAPLQERLLLLGLKEEGLGLCEVALG